MASEKAHQIAEDFIGQRLLVREWVAELAQSARWQQLPERPVQTIGGNLAIEVDIDSAGDGWVRTPYRSAKVRYRAGMAYTEDQIPEPIRVALAEIDQHLEGGGSPENLPPRVVAFLKPYQRLGRVLADENR